jgi:SagB-type dehydrogenase family enzyme
MMTLEAAIDIRRSAEAFTTLPVQLADLSFVLQMAAGSDALRRTPGVRLFAVVHRVARLEPGVYEYLPSARGLALVRGGAYVGPILKAVGQKLAGTAGVALVMAAQLSGGRSPLGERWYRDLLLESGAMAQRTYLAAESAGLAARNLAAFVDDHFNEKLELAALDLAALHLIVIGNGN